jgi:hypothetical protein
MWQRTAPRGTAPSNPYRTPVRVTCDSCRRGRGHESRRRDPPAGPSPSRRGGHRHRRGRRASARRWRAALLGRRLARPPRPLARRPTRVAASGRRVGRPRRLCHPGASRSGGSACGALDRRGAPGAGVGAWPRPGRSIRPIYFCTTARPDYSGAADGAMLGHARREGWRDSRDAP